MYISYDETLLENTATVIIHIEQLRKKTMPRVAVFRMSYAEYIRKRTELFEHQEQMAKSNRREFDKKMERFRRIRDKVEHEQHSVSRGDPHGGALLKKKMGTVLAMGRRFEREKESFTEFPESEDAIFIRLGENAALPSGKTVLDLELDELKAADKTLCKNIRLKVHGGEHICITGRNGVRKSTLIKAIATELLTRKDIAAAYMPQNYDELLCGNMTPVDFIATGFGREERTKARSYLGSMKFTRQETEHSMDELSGGQRAKLFFAKMALENYNVLILDEPTRNLSPLSGPEIRKMLKEFKGSIISVSHDRKYISEVCERVLCLSPTGLSEK